MAGFWSWTRGATPGGAVEHRLIGTELRVVARMSRSRIVGSRMVFGKVVSESDHTPRPESWEVYEGERALRWGLTLKQAKQDAERRADAAARAWALAQVAEQEVRA